MSILTIILALIISFVLYISYRFAFLPWKRLQYYKKQGLKVDFFPLIGSFILKNQQSLKKYDDSLHDLKVLAKEQPKLKAIVRNLGPSAIVLITDPALKKEVAFNHNLYELPNIFGEVGKLMMRGLVGVSGDEWKKQRKTISQSFHFEFLKENVPIVVSATRQFVKDLANRESLKEVEVLKAIENIAGENIGKIFFSDNLKEYCIKGKLLSAYLMDFAVRFGKAILSVGYLVFGPKYIKKGIFKIHRDVLEDIDLIQDTCQRILTDRRKNNLSRKDLAWYLMESQKNALEEDRLTDEDIIANFAAFISAGTNTTTHMVSMTLYALAQHPEMLERLRNEIKQVYDKEDAVTVDTLNQMNWLTALFKETLRIYNPTGTGSGFRKAIKDHMIGDLHIKEGTFVSVSFVHTHFSPEYFENPMEYQPQRWIDKPTLNEPYAYTPFWAGSRNCIGQHLAMIEGKIILCEFVKMFDFETIEGYKLKLGIRQAYGPMDNLPMNLKVRKEL